MELFLQLFQNKWVMLLLSSATYYGCWYLIFRLGVRILGEPAPSKRIYLAALIMLLCSLARSVVPMYVFVILVITLITLLLMFIIKKFLLLKCLWTAFLLYLVNIVGDLFLFSFSSVNQGVYDFFFRTSYGAIVGILVEALFPALALIILRKYPSISLIPPLERIDSFNIIVIVTIGALTYVVYYSLMEFYNKFREDPGHILANLKLIWVASIAAGSGALLILGVLNKRYELKKQELENERTQREFERQRYEAELRQTQDKIDALNNEILELEKINESLQTMKTAPQKLLEDVTNALNNAYSTVGRLEDFKRTLKSQTETGRVFESDFLSGLIFNETELKIIELIIEGKTNDEIGKAIHLSAGRVSNIITEILAKTGAKDRTVLAVQYVMSRFKNEK